MIGASLLLLTLGLDRNLSRLDSALLFVLLIAYTVFLVAQSRRESAATAAETALPTQRRAARGAHWSVQVGLIAAGLALLVVGSGWLVDAAVTFAKALGVSDLVIGLTIVAAGTSMPEVATSVMAAIRGERDIAVGNVVGSCTFNILGCLGLAGLFAPAGLPLAPSLINFDLWVMIAVAFACLPVFLSGREIARWEGLLFTGYYAAYTAFLILAAQEHDALPALSTAMLGFVLPLTVVTLIVTLLRPTEASRP